MDFVPDDDDLSIQYIEVEQSTPLRIKLALAALFLVVGLIFNTIFIGVIVSVGLGTNIFCGGVLSLLPTCLLGRILVPELLRKDPSAYSCNSDSDCGSNPLGNGICRNSRCYLPDGRLTTTGACIGSSSIAITGIGETGPCYTKKADSCLFGIECASGNCSNGVCAERGVINIDGQRGFGQYCVLPTDCAAFDFGITVLGDNNTASLTTTTDLTLAADENTRLGVFNTTVCKDGLCNIAGGTLAPAITPLLIGYNYEIDFSDFSSTRFFTKVWFYLFAIAAILNVVSILVALFGNHNTAINIFIISLLLYIAALIDKIVLNI